jgi:hypothetical protein
MTSFIADPPGPPDPGPDPEFCCQQDVVINIGDVGVEQTVLLDAGGGLDPCPNPGTPITVVSALGSGTYFYNGYVQPCCAVGAALQQAWPNAAVFIVAAP